MTHGRGKWARSLVALACLLLSGGCLTAAETPEFFQFGIGNINVFEGQAMTGPAFSGRRVLVRDIVVIQNPQSGPIGTVRFSIADHDLATNQYPGRFRYRFDTTSVHINLSAGLVLENGIRIYNHGLSDNPLSFHILGIYLPDA